MKEAVSEIIQEKVEEAVATIMKTNTGVTQASREGGETKTQPVDDNKLMYQKAMEDMDVEQMRKSVTHYPAVFAGKVQQVAYTPREFAQMVENSRKMG
jgi:hypothetical protein